MLFEAYIKPYPGPRGNDQLIVDTSPGAFGYLGFMSEHRAPIGKDEFERLKRLEAELRAQVVGFSGADRLSRDQLHERGVDVGPPVKPAIQDDQ